MFSVAIFDQRVLARRAEATTKRCERTSVKVLIAKDQYWMFSKGVRDPGKLYRVERAR